MSKIRIIILILLLPFHLTAKEYQIKLSVKGLPENAKPLLLRMYNGALLMLDSLPKIEGEIILFKVPENTPPGMLRSILGQSVYARYTNGQVSTVDFIFNREDIDMQMNFERPIDSLQIISSVENTIYYNFLKEDAILFRKLGLIENTVINYPEQDEFYNKALEYYRKYQQQRDKFIDKTSAANAKTLASKIIRNQKLPMTEGRMERTQRDSIFRNDFLKYTDFSDTTLLYTNVYTDNVFRYIQMFMKQNASPRENEANCIQALDKLVPHLETNPIVQQRLLQFLIEGFERMKMEEVLAHISANYLQQCGGNADIVKRRLEGYRKMAIGEKVPNFTIEDIKGTPVNLYDQINPYTLIVFWHSGCSHCLQLLNALPELNKKGAFEKYQLKVIGISIDEQKEEWLKFSEKYGLNWINTYIEDGFDNPIANDYNLFATPTMFLIDSDYKIIAKPTTLQELIGNLDNVMMR